MLRDFSDTVAFVKVVQEGSFTAAARVLKVPKTRVSRKVQELESRLHTQLLNRTTRSLKLTEAGAVYFQHCERVVKNLEDAENAVAELQQHPRGWLRITAPVLADNARPRAAAHRVSPLLSRGVPAIAAWARGRRSRRQGHRHRFPAPGRHPARFHAHGSAARRIADGHLWSPGLPGTCRNATASFG